MITDWSTFWIALSFLLSVIFACICWQDIREDDRDFERDKWNAEHEKDDKE